MLYRLVKVDANCYNKQLFPCKKKQIWQKKTMDNIKSKIITFFVTVYLLLVLSYLFVTGQLPRQHIIKVAYILLGKKYKAKVKKFNLDEGYCWRAKLPKHLCTDAESTSRIVVYEDGTPLPSGHASHDEIRKLGLGRFSHWGNGLFFSASDNTEPTKNGRMYTVKEI